ncbi:hypothetical protein [Streptomyces litchfieldiae]|uniref:Integral membrane protein n=1 Tax=Streptomyces litchfieldiae TaxID=3075543 RepID=A0ABU2MI95_9ACTN|nr:hypothetical protein [Streptomyces sp. DSM 44938]MDT0341301.1 hypothetical protein [Streptomyces sp. DSM 44938]
MTADARNERHRANDGNEGNDDMTAEPTTYDRRMLRLMNREDGARLHARRGQRRAWTAAHIALTAATPAAFPLAGDNAVLLLALVVPLTLAWCVCTGVLNASTRGLLELRARVLDERQLAERGRAHTAAHRAQLSLMLAAFAGLGIAVGISGEITAGPLAAVLLGLLLTHWLLPLWIAALRAPDEPQDDVVEEAGRTA